MSDGVLLLRRAGLQDVDVIDARKRDEDRVPGDAEIGGIVAGYDIVAIAEQMNGLRKHLCGRHIRCTAPEANPLDPRVGDERRASPHVQNKLAGTGQNVPRFGRSRKVGTGTFPCCGAEGRWTSPD